MKILVIWKTPEKVRLNRLKTVEKKVEAVVEAKVNIIKNLNKNLHKNNMKYHLKKVKFKKIKKNKMQIT